MDENSTENAVKIAVRERPSKDRESIIHYNATIKNILIANDRHFAFDYIFQPHSIQKEVFDTLGQPLVKKTLQGYNCNIFAYGQTGTGKTYTMGLTQNLQDDCAGIIPRCLSEIFQTESQTTRKIFVSYIEIYNEKVFDMLSTNSREQIYVKGCKFSGGNKTEIQTAEEGFNFLMKGNKNRHVRATKMNAESSRSHAIFTVHVEQVTDMISSISMLNLVDLAGSEGVRRTGHQGIALSEGVNINQGLLSVGKVMQALNSGSKVIPYRDSILTSVLQDSLNINSYLTLLACISSEKIDKSETLYTLRFAQSAKSLPNNPLINTVILEYQKQKRQTASKMLTPLRIKNIYTPYLKKKDLKSVKSLKKANSFCSPRKVRKMEIKKLNSTDVKKKKSKFFSEEIYAREYEKVNKNFDSVKRSIESSITSLLNASTSTTLETPTYDLHVSNEQKFRNDIPEILFEPTTYVGELTDKSIKQKEYEDLQAPIHSNSIWNSMKNDLRDIIRQELLSLTGNTDDTEIVKKNQHLHPTSKSELKFHMLNKIDEQNVENKQKNVSPNPNYIFNSMKGNIRNLIRKELISLKENKDNINVDTYQTNNKIDKQNYQSFQEDLLFKVPDSLHKEEMETSNTFRLTKESSTLHPRRSHRLSRRFSNEHQMELSSSISNSTTQNLLASRPIRSHRLSRRVTKDDSFDHKMLRRSCRLEAKKLEQTFSQTDVKSYKHTEVEKSKNKKLQNGRMALPTTNKIISSYFSNNSNQNSKNSKTQHQKAVLDLLNNGSIKELQILPYIGLKTAYQIIIQRTLNGKFRNFEVVSKLPVWRGKAWDRFKEANNL